MKRAEAREEIVRALMSDMSYQEVVEEMVEYGVNTWSDSELADFLWGNDYSQTIEED